MAYDIKDVVKVQDARGGFYGVVVGKTLGPVVEYHIAALNGKAAWRVTEDYLHPTDRGFQLDDIERAIASYVVEEPLPFQFSLNSEALKRLAVEGVIEVRGHRIAAEPAMLGHAKLPIKRDASLRMYWISL